MSDLSAIDPEILDAWKEKERKAIEEHAYSLECEKELKRLAGDAKNGTKKV